MTDSADLRTPLAAFGLDYDPAGVTALGGAGGFSGALFWRVQTPAGPRCLRRWPSEHPAPSRLQFIHNVLVHVSAGGLRTVPAPVRTLAGETFVAHRGHLWELATWLPGTADYRAAQSLSRLRSAMRALAAFHRAAESYPLPQVMASTSPSLRFRVDRWRELQAGGADRLEASLDDRWPELAALGRLCLTLYRRAAPSAGPVLASAESLYTAQQPCIRDIWHDHVLFVGDEVTGLVDFGAMQVDTVAADVARLLGSLVADNVESWTHGLAAYESVRPLSLPERALVAAFDRANVLLAGTSWLEWCFGEQREFENRSGVLSRMREHVQRLQTLADRGG